MCEITPTTGPTTCTVSAQKLLEMIRRAREYTDYTFDDSCAFVVLEAMARHSLTETVTLAFDHFSMFQRCGVFSKKYDEIDSFILKHKSLLEKIAAWEKHQHDQGNNS